MPDTLEVKLRTQASTNAGLVALLGDGPEFRWYDVQVKQGTDFPAVAVQLIAGNNTYATTGRLPTGWSRYQFTIWDPDSERCRQTESALISFLDTFNACMFPGAVQPPAYPNLVVLQRQGFVPTPTPPKFTRIVDAMIFSNDTF